MKMSLLSSFESTTLTEEQDLFVTAWRSERDLAFVGYKDNEGRRRIKDVAELIDRALAKIDESDYKAAARVYHDTLKQVSMYTMLARMLESASGS
ncbi:MAG: hypothetical protein RTU30_05655 [Candidatus Thorarchaeota archaeon]